MFPLLTKGDEGGLDMSFQKTKVIHTIVLFPREVPMRRAALTILITLLAIFLISACAQPTRLDKNYGKSFKQARLNQILDPEGEKNLEPVTGLDGKAAQASIEKYRRAFGPPRETPQPLVQIGSQGGPSTLYQTGAGR